MSALINEAVFNAFPELESERLLYRAYKITDASALLDIRSHAKVSQYLDATIPKQSADAQKRIEGYHNAFKNHEGITWAIIEKTSNTLIGDFGIWHIDKQHARGDIGYILHPNFWKNGYMSEAMHTLIRFGFHTINLHSFAANVNTKNNNSKALLLKFGFKLEAYFRESFYYDGQYLDSEIYCLIASDLK